MTTGAILFDIDGTLAHTDPLHIRAFNVMLAREGKATISDAEYFSTVMGFANVAIFERFFPERSPADRKALADFKEATFRDLARTELQPMPGLMDLLDWADGLAIPMAAVTNAPTLNANLILDGIDVKRRFRTVVIGDELPRGKPDPMPYLVGGERLGVPLGRCVAFEDSRSGMTSASAAGACAIGVLSSLTEPDLVKVGARFAVKDFNDPRLRPLIREVVGV
jgi:HAD superfamily hydrolase (TIGR01509 family)